ncbi:SusC/RagA family TonB-linked outer membrane protein [Neptunitalea chrysea]|uniref:SusC/RagA family TonB-linked outer membrane protein n=2 Tax=Neptunitalea chrysea TaxID=1647581 RepID=A0A9W6EUL4_9FLAO|nr:SusC/RagA family TonB-linked outer membrane protein [Neptunitalea chrysea]
MYGQETVTGKITDKDKVPLPGVSIQVKGTDKGTSSDFDGNYTIEAPTKDAVLVFSYVGFKNEEVLVGNQKVINITMSDDLEQLGEVVVVGYGTQRKEAITGSVASLASDELKEVPSPNVSQALQGRVVGVELSQTSSKPGAAMQIRIRGTRSLTANNDPLIVLDGIPFFGSIGDINPNDIKSLDILKDASATAIYGSRGANGVILITTTKGYKGQTAKFTYNSYVGLKTLFARYPMMNGPEFVKLRAYAGMFTQNGEDEYDDVNTDWQDLLYSNALLTSHDFGVSGGGEKGSYNFGSGYYREESVLPGQDYQRYSLRGTVNQEIGVFKFGITTNNNYSVSNGNNLGLYTTLSTTPIANPYNEDGSLKDIVKLSADNQYVYTKERIEGLGDKWIDRTRAFGTYNNLYGEVEIPGVEGLSYRTNIGLNLRVSNSGSYTGEGVFSSEPTTLSRASVGNSFLTHWVLENLLTYDRTFAKKHHFNVVGLYSAEERQYNSTYTSATDIPSDAFQFYNLGQAQGEITVNPDYQGYYKSGLMSYMARIMYDYDNKYMFSATWRNDGSSRLASGHEWHSYPAVSAGWNVTSENFMKDIKVINQLKFRVGYGETSNQSVDPYATLGRLTSRPYNFGDDYVTGLYVTTLPNPNLGWEYSTTWNYGVDFGLFDNRLSGTIEYYVTNTKDLLLGVNLPSTSGVSSYTGNVGATENKGIEFSLKGVIVETDDFTWDAGINIYANKNKIVSLASGQDRDESNWWFVGHSINSIYDYKYEGLWQEGDPYLDILEPGGNVGMIKVKYTGGYDDDGVPLRQVNADDRQIMNVDPDFQGGFNTRATYKNFDLSLVGAFKSGGLLISTLYSSAGYLNMLSGRRNNVDVDYWTEDNTNAKYPKPGGIENSNNPKYGSTLGYFDASYVKIRAITLGYNFNQQFIKDVGIDNCRLYFTVQNPFVLFSPYYKESGMDPETNSYGDENQAVASYKERFLVIGTNTPSNRNFLLGLNLTF